MKIDVTPLIFPNIYDTLSSSVNASIKENKDKNVQVGLINGQNLISYCYKRDLLSLFFSNSKCLIISIGNNAINWRVIEEKPSDDNDIFKTNIVLKLPDGDEYDWGGKILDQMLNKKISISPSDQNLFIYTDEERVEYMFDAYAERKNKNNKFIFLFEC